MDRLVLLGVGTEGAEDYFSTFQDISELARNLGETHDYVDVTVSVIGEDSSDEANCDREHLYYDENTLSKVRAALMDAAGPYGHGDQYVDDMLYAMQNAGILFRERPKSKGD